MSYNPHHFSNAPRGQQRICSLLNQTEEYPPAPPAIDPNTLPLPPYTPPFQPPLLRAVDLPDVTPTLVPSALPDLRAAPRAHSHDFQGPVPGNTTPRAPGYAFAPARDQERPGSAVRSRPLPAIPSALSAQVAAPAPQGTEDAGARSRAGAGLAAGLAALTITPRASHAPATAHDQSRVPPPVPRPDTSARRSSPTNAERADTPTSVRSGHRSSGSADSTNSLFGVGQGRVSDGTPPTSPEDPEFKAADDVGPVLVDLLRYFADYHTWDLRTSKEPPTTIPLDASAFTSHGRSELKLMFNPLWTLATRGADEQGGPTFSCTVRREDRAPLMVRDVLGAIGRKMYKSTQWLTVDDPNGSWRYERAVKERRYRLGGDGDTMVNVDWYPRRESVLLELHPTDDVDEVLVILGDPSQN
ncbi:uncharacterized protein BXZ73DRAFT_80872 [Epithele typhae]|uniref:uncharacterized protein n=1 Tax=Epithele typhae TaxID=378194 RepID=UPI002008A5B5|nr:uncharacterized protein BXZ73DRAFT_80872 [Epithele typhae]KAH9917108.1 hypothetical protein BXZ73DRAFT_80872 [Epithele typhae]